MVYVAGALVTYFLIPSYNAQDLEDPDSYLALEHAWFRPSEATVQYMKQTQEAKAAPYTMIEIVDRADNYCLNTSTRE